MARRGAIGAIGARGISILASFLLTFVVARLLDVEEAGTFFLIFTSLAIAATFGRFGTDNLALKLVGGASANVRRDVGRLAIVSAAASALSVAVGIVVVVGFGLKLPGVENASIAIVATAVIPQALAVLAGALLRARGRLVVGTFAELGSLPTIATLGLLAYAAVGNVTLVGALYCLAAASWLTALWAVTAAVLSIRKVSPSATRDDQSLSSFVRKYIGQLAPMMGTSLIFYAVTWVPIFALTAVGNLEAVSFYTVAARLAGFVGLIPAIQVSYLAPTFARLYQERDVAALNRLAARSAVTALAVAALPAAALIVAPGLILHVLYGDPYESAAPALIWLTVGVLITVVAGQVNQLMLLCDLEHFALWLNVGLLAFWALAGLYAAEMLGLLGVVAVSVTVTAIYQIAAVAKLRSKASILSYARVLRE